MSRARSLLQRLRSAGAVTWAVVLGVLPLPVWFAAQALLAPAPAWRAEYRPREAGGPGSPATVFERQLGRYWDRSDRAVPGGADVHAFSARWLACLSVDSAREVPFMLVANGAAAFALDGVELLRLPAQKARGSVGAVLPVGAGMHLLSVQLDASGWPSIALLASFDGAPPAALGSGRLAPGVRLAPPSSGPVPCAGSSGAGAL